MDSLGGKALLVTGAAGNLGRAVTESALGRGARVVATDRSRALLDEVLVASDDLELVAAADLTEAATCEDLIARATARFGRLDGLITTVGGFAFAPVADDDRSTWDRMFALNLHTALELSRAVLPVMTEAGRGAIVLTGAAAALKAPAGVSAYAASKSAVMRLAESLAEELAGTGIRVNCVLPTIIDTPQNRAAMPDADTASWVSPGSVADLMLYLVSDESRAVNGALIPAAGAG